MTDKQKSEVRAIAAALETLDMGGVADLVRRQYAELETLRAKLKTYEDLGGAGSDVQLLRMGYAAARLETESLRAAQPAGAPQPGAAYAALPESLILAVDRWFSANTGLGGCSDKDVRELAELFYGVTHAGGRESVDDALAIVESFGLGIDGLNDTYARQILLADEVKRLRASHGQAPAQAAPAAVAGCTRSHPHENMDNACRAKAALAEMRSKAARGAEATAHDLDRFVALLTAKPTTQPSPAAQGDALTQAARDVLAERQRQISVEGWTPERDDEYRHGELSSAAGCYALYNWPHPTDICPVEWPWDAAWWKPATYRRSLEKAGALILAELERIDRAAQKGGM